MVKTAPGKPATTISRPPVVTVMGHVDHGKSTLVETIRQINITGKEHGGITQHIGAYQVNWQGKPITVIDTPGHAAFAKMRSRGAAVTDLVILVVAADDGVMPQTKESWEHIQAAGVPVVIAINKIDLPQANIEKVKSQLAENGIYVEGYGGDVVCVPVSAKLKQNLDQLLEMVLLVAEMRELKADPKAKLEAVVIEAQLDQQRGPVATVLVKNGTLTLGQEVWAENGGGKVKAMFDDIGKPIKTAGPSQPAQVLGLKAVPPVGAIISDQRLVTSELVKPTVQNKEGAGGDKLKIILKTDTQGTLEAIRGSLSDDVLIIAQGVGEVNESEVMLAGGTKAAIVAFNVPVAKTAVKLAELDGIKIKTYRIIYELLEDMDKQVLRMLEPTIDEEELGTAEIVAEFAMKQRVAGVSVKTGVIEAGATVHLRRGEVMVGEAKIGSLHKGKETVTQVKAGNDCGLVLRPEIDFKIGDMIVSYRKLSAT